MRGNAKLQKEYVLAPKVAQALSLAGFCTGSDGRKFLAIHNPEKVKMMRRNLRLAAGHFFAI
jgi:hypothetical protein